MYTYWGLVMNRYNFQTDVLVYGRAVWELVVVGSLSHGTATVIILPPMSQLVTMQTWKSLDFCCNLDRGLLRLISCDANTEYKGKLWCSSLIFWGVKAARFSDCSRDRDVTRDSETVILFSDLSTWCCG